MQKFSNRSLKIAPESLDYLMDSQGILSDESEQVMCSIPTDGSFKRGHLGKSPPIKDSHVTKVTSQPCRKRKSIDVGSGSSINKASALKAPISPFIVEARASKNKSFASRESALGALRKDASPHAETSFSNGGSDSREESPLPAFLPLSRRAPILDRMERASHLSRPASPPTSRPSCHRRGIAMSPIAHEVVRKVSTRSPLDGGAPSDEAFKSAFITCLELVCEQNADQEEHAYPRGAGEDKLVEAVFPIPISRHYSPDFLRHVLRHMQLSRRSLAAALVYLDRARARKGLRMMVCNKNVNVLALCCLVMASRVVERRGYSDEIMAMLSGMPDAQSLRRSIAFCLEQFDYDARMGLDDTGPYEAQLARMCGGIEPPHIAPEHADELMLKQEQIDSRNKVLKMYYPRSSLDL